MITPTLTLHHRGGGNRGDLHFYVSVSYVPSVAVLSLPDFFLQVLYRQLHGFVRRLA
jgi:hypothetical protein